MRADGMWRVQRGACKVQHGRSAARVFAEHGLELKPDSTRRAYFQTRPYASNPERCASESRPLSRNNYTAHP